MKANHLLNEYNCYSSKDSNTKDTLYIDENIHRPATLLQTSVFGLKIIDGFGDCGVLAILFFILSGGRFLIERTNFVIFQIKYFRQTLFHAEIYATASDGQKNSNMNDLSDFIGENNIYKLKEKIVKLSVITVNLTK